jgi:predicted TIM-barrel fold metal-dependent hydrolase
VAEHPPVIDVDGHAQDRPELIRKHLEPPWDRRPTALSAGDQPWDRENFRTIKPYPGFARGMSPADQIELWHRIMDEHGIEHVALFPGTGGAPRLREPEFAAAVCRATNSHYAKDWNSLSDRVHVLGILPIRQPAEAAKELRRAVTELGIIAFEILPTALATALGDPCYDPVYEEAARLGAALVVRGTPSHSDNVGASSFTTFNEVHTYAIPAGLLLQFTSMIFHGVPVRFPGLRLAFLEAGASWLPYWLDRMDAHWELRGEVETPHLKKRPSDVVRESPIYLSVDASETLLPQTVAYLGDDHFVYSTDLPHWDTEFPESIERIWAHPGLSTETKEKILHRNARAYLKL